MQLSQTHGAREVTCHYRHVNRFCYLLTWICDAFGRCMCGCVCVSVYVSLRMMTWILLQIYPFC